MESPEDIFQRVAAISLLEPLGIVEAVEGVVVSGVACLPSSITFTSKTGRSQHAQIATPLENYAIATSRCQMWDLLFPVLPVVLLRIESHSHPRLRLLTLPHFHLPPGKTCSIRTRTGRLRSSFFCDEYWDAYSMTRRQFCLP